MKEDGNEILSAEWEYADKVCGWDKTQMFDYIVDGFMECYKLLQSQLTEKDKQIRELQEENKDIQQSCENYYNEMRSYKNKVEDLEKQFTKAKKIIIECLPKLKRGNWWSLYYKAETFLNKE